MGLIQSLLHHLLIELFPLQLILLQLLHVQTFLLSPCTVDRPERAPEEVAQIVGL
jgi:hypothetical protein